MKTNTKWMIAALVATVGLSGAAWAADGAVCGGPYFTGPNPARHLPAKDFYRTYIAPILHRIRQSPTE